MFTWLKQLIQTESDRDRVERQLASLTPRARLVLHSARREADRMQHQTLDTGHLLLALLRFGQGIVTDVLSKLGVNRGALRTELEKALAQAEGDSPPADPAFSPAVTLVLTRASQEAQAMHHACVGTEHLLLALLRDDTGQAGRALRSMGIDIEMARRAVLQEMNPTGSQGGWSETELVNFTPRARHVLHSARREADRMQHQTLDTGHLLLALLGLGQGIAIDVLRTMGAKQGALRIELEKAVAQAETDSPPADSARSPVVTMVLARASQEAQILHHAYVGTEHLLLALLRDDAGQAGRVLRSMGIDVEIVRMAVLQELCPTWSDADLAETEPINLTLRAQQVLALARQEAVRLRDDSIRTEHVLFGLLRLKQGVAIRVLGRMGVLVDAVQREVTRLLGTPKDAPIPDDPPYDAVVKLVLASASQEAKAMHRSCVGTEHILLGLLRHSSGPTGGLLQVLELDVDETRRAILKELEPSRRAE